MKVQSPYPEGSNKEKSWLATQATHAARKRLMEMFQDEYAELLAEERTARGLPELPNKDAMDALRKRVEELEEMLREYGESV